MVGGVDRARNEGKLKQDEVKLTSSCFRLSAQP
jgi:hypothetical protein